MSNWWDADPVASGQPARITVTPNYGNAISSIESGGNYRAVGPQTGKGRALGKYQVMDFNVGPWTEKALGQRMTPMQFLASPEAQDKVFESVFGDYVKQYGPEGAARAWFAGEGGMNNPNARDVLGTSVSAYADKFNRALGAQPAAPQQAAGAAGGNWWDADPVASDEASAGPVAERFAEPQAPANAEALQSGLERRARDMTTGPATTPMQRMAIEHGNLQSAASQRATPNMDILSKNLISTEVFQGDDGSIQFRDPQTGQVVPTDNTKHIVMRDPADNTPKVYAKTEDATESPAVGVARVLAPGLISGSPTARAMIPAAMAPKPGQAVTEAAGRIGVQVPRAVATDSMAMQRTAAAARNIPVAGDPLVRSAERAITQLGDKADEVAKGFGSGGTVASGDAARGGISRYVTETTKARAAELYDKVDELAGNASGPLFATKTAVQRILARRGEAALPEGEATNIVSDALKRNAMTYEGIKTLRSNVGEYIDSGILPAGMSQAELKQIYAGLTSDLQSVVRSAGPQASAAFQRANNYYRLASERNAALAKIIGKDGNAPVEQVFDRLVGMASSSSRADIAKLAQARKAMGADDWNEFVSGLVARMGRDPAAKGAPEALQASDFSPQRFLTAYGKLSPEGRAMLFRSGGKGGLANALDDIAAVSTRFRELQKFANPSGTGQTVLGGLSIAAIWADPLTTLTTLAGGRIAAAALSRPAKAASVAHWARTYEQLVRTPSTPRLAQFELASRNLANNLRDLGVNLSPSDFLRAIQAPVKSTAEGEEPAVPGRPGE